MNLPKGLKQIGVEENALRHRCGHCENEGCADLIGIFIDTLKKGKGAVDTYTCRTWHIYFCPTCRNINLIGFYESEDDFFDVKEKTLYPSAVSAEVLAKSEKLPSDLTVDYEEAQNVAEISPRSAAALLRLLLEKLCKKYLLENNKIKGSEKLNTMIGILVKEGISDTIQKACDILRITGNETVHAGTIDIRDNPESVKFFFELVNMIADYLYMKYKRIPEIYSTLPTDKLDGIEKRDSQKQIMEMTDS